MPDEILYDAGWMKLKKTKNDFIFSERKGVDSVAVLLYRHSRKGDSIELEVLIRKQPLPIENERMDLFSCPITGQIEEGRDLIDVAVGEIKEEGGYIVDPVDVVSVGKYIVGTQTNEVVSMFICNVTEKDIVEIEGDGSFHESISHNEWHSLDYGLSAEYSGLYIIAHKLMRILQLGD